MHHRDGLRQRVGVDHEGAGGRPVGSADQGHRLRGRRGLVEQGGVGGGQAGQVTDHGLEVQQCLEPALGDLRLVRRVGGVPAGILQHIAANHRRGGRSVVAEPDHRLAGVVARRASARSSAAACRLGGGPRQAQLLGGADALGDRGVHQRLERVEPERGQHRGPVLVPGSDVTDGEGPGGVELGQRGMVGHRGSWRTWGQPVRSPPPLSATTASSSRVASPARSWRLRGSGEDLPLRRSAVVVHGDSPVRCQQQIPAYQGRPQFLSSRDRKPLSLRRGLDAGRRARPRRTRTRRTRWPARWAARPGSPRSRARPRRWRCRRHPGRPGAGR